MSVEFTLVLVVFIDLLKEQKHTLNMLIERNDTLFGNNPSSGGLVSPFSSELAPQQLPNIQAQLQEAPQQPQLCVPPPPPPTPTSPPPFGEPLSDHFFSLDFFN